jgi:hypothetical protein
MIAEGTADLLSDRRVDRLLVPNQAIADCLTKRFFEKTRKPPAFFAL